MDLAFSKFDTKRAQPLDGLPDYPVLLAGLSARQSITPTARIQTLLETTAATGSLASTLVALFAEGDKPDPALSAGQFSAAAAVTLSHYLPR